MKLNMLFLLARLRQAVVDDRLAIGAGVAQRTLAYVIQWRDSDAHSVVGTWST